MFSISNRKGRSLVQTQKVLSLIFVWFIAFTSQASEIETLGFGIIENNNIPKAREAALLDAKRVAAEQLLGSFISARTTTNNFMLASEQIYATTRGKLDRYEIIDEGKLDAQTYQVKIKAFIDAEDAAQEALNLIKRNDWSKKPRIKLITQDSGTDLAKQAESAFLSALSANLRRENFVVLNENSELGSSFELELQVNATNKNGEYQGIKISNTDLSISGSLLNSSTGEQVTSVSFSDNKAGSVGKAVNAMTTKIAQRVAQKVNMATTSAWLSELKLPILLNVEGASSRQVEKIQLNLKNAVIGLTGLSVESQNDDDYRYSASYFGWPEQLYDQLSQLAQNDDINFKVVNFNESKITLTVK